MLEEVEGGRFIKLVKWHSDPMMLCSILFGTKHEVPQNNWLPEQVNFLLPTGNPLVTRTLDSVVIGCSIMPLKK